MAQLEIEVTLDNGAESFGAVKYQPGSEVKGTVTIFPDGDVECKHLYIRLEWHTEGRGTRYQEPMDELDVYQGTLKGGFPSSYEFNFHLPDEPWSYEGHYVSVVWAVTVQVDVPWAKDAKYEEAFVMRPEMGGRNW